MAARRARSFKTDESFLEKIAIGAIGTRKVFDHLSVMGQKPVALDRGSMSFKLWKTIKIKRLRVPDILCVASGTCIESRAKTNLQISMSHSTSDPDRGWDFGLADDDFVALPVCSKVGDGPVDWEASDLVQYVRVGDLRRTFSQGLVIQETPKGSQEGFETRLTWPASVASSDGTISEIADTRLKFRRVSDGTTISLSRAKRNIALTPLVREGDTIRAGQIVLSVVPVHTEIPTCGPLDADHYVSMLNSRSLSDRYASAKALAFFDDERVAPALQRILEDLTEHIYVKLEAAATLMQAGSDTGQRFIEDTLRAEYLENRLEAVIVLGEIRTSESMRILCQCLLDGDQHAEIRAGAAWSLGEMQSSDAVGALLRSFEAVSVPIRAEAARALAKLARQHRARILDSFPTTPPESRPGVAWALARAGGFTVADLLPLRVDDDARQWIAYMIGNQPPEQFVAEIALLQSADPEVYFGVNVLWKILTSWTHGLTEY